MMSVTEGKQGGNKRRTGEIGACFFSAVLDDVTQERKKKSAFVLLKPRVVSQFIVCYIIFICLAARKKKPEKLLEPVKMVTQPQDDAPGHS